MVGMALPGSRTRRHGIHFQPGRRRAPRFPRSAETNLNDLATDAVLLAVDRLSVVMRTRRGSLNVVSEASLAVAPGEIIGIVGESGSGKSVTSLAVIGILPPAAKVIGGSLRF